MKGLLLLLAFSSRLVRRETGGRGGREGGIF